MKYLEIFILIGVLFASYVGVRIFRRWSLRREIFDVPNERSSHTKPTARGGGLVIVIICLTVYTFYTNFVSNNFQISYLIGASLIALISWLDDLYSVSFVWRFLVHAVSAILVILTLGYFREFYVPIFWVTDSGIFGFILTFVWIVWITNAYNFMDGIDGIAGMQAVTAGFGWLIIGETIGYNSTGFYGGVIALSSLGFLIQNWQPATIFMGDVGSAFLGYSFAVLPLLAKNESIATADKNPYLPAISLLLLWLFIFDTVITFLRRVLNGEKVWEAHRNHLYQRMNISGLSHQFVSSLYGIISVLTVCFTIFWINRKSNNWELILMFFILLQSLGLFIYTQFTRKNAL